MEPVDISPRQLNGDINIHPKKVYDYYAQNMGVLLHQIALGFDALGHDGHLALIDLFNILDIYTDKPLNDMQSSEPHFVNEYLNGKMFAL